ncbi:hypothetical protein BO70DRAFT_391918 [Aspergillus heteromorphus CBS 117.55]|uniref:Uncharacterized protein n=1 Tax=Aspergillus heteromorphus CBS 117.55 TaxID=1448321 RepID=A0A317X1K1_9EURO|nr:uncharacterized protein BO70DRAFT_391918 [Aspergillus heteromorphus CBS 117.55]PWY92514.1 hypothetical protein BO70DRAFT_391918 [Aspergillus heteromorphus CBS 117.55]
MKDIFKPLVYVALCIIAMAEGVTRYQTDPPAGVIVLQDRQALNDLVTENPETFLNPENGGYYLKTSQDEEVIAIAGDELCAELDTAVATVEALGDDYDDDDDDDDEGVTKREDNLACGGDCSLENLKVCI